MWRLACFACLLLASGIRWISSPGAEWSVPEGPLDAVSYAAPAPAPYLSSMSSSKLIVAATGRWMATAQGQQLLTWRMPLCVVNPTAAYCDVQQEPTMVLKLSEQVDGLQALDGDLFAIQAASGVSLWAYERSSPICKLEHSPAVVAMASESDWMFTGTKDGKLHMWENEQVLSYKKRWDYSIAHALPGESFEITSLALSMGERWFSAAIFQSNEAVGRVMVWNTSFWRRPGHFLRFYSQISRILSISFAPTGSWMVTGTQTGAISAWSYLDSTDSPKNVRFSQWPVRALSFSPDGNWLVSSDSAGHVRLWPVNQHLTTVAKAAGIDSPGGGAAALSADTGFLLMIQGSSHKVVAWPLDLRIPSFSYQFAQGVEGVRDLLLSPNGRYMLTGNLDRTSESKLRLWEVEPNAQRLLFDMPVEGLFCCMLAFSEDHVFIGSTVSQKEQNASSRIEMWHVPWSSALEPGLKLSKRARKSVYELPKCFLRAFALSSDQQHLICACGNRVIMVQRKDEEDESAGLGTVRSYWLPPSVQATTLLALPNSFAVGTSDGSVCMELFGSVNIKDPSRCFYPGSKINVLELSPDAEALYTGGTNGRICRFLVRSKILNCFSQPGIPPTSTSVLSLALESWKLASTSTNGILAVWNVNLTDLTEQRPILIFQTSSYELRMVLSPDYTYYYTSGTAGAIQAYLVNSTSTSVQRMKGSPVCLEGRCTTDSVEYHSAREVAMPSFLANLPLRWLSLQGAKISRMSPQPPISLRRANLSGAWLADWRSMCEGWWWMPSVIDVTGATGFVDLPVVHGPALRLVTDENCIAAAAAAKEHNSQRQFCIARAAQRLGELCATSFVSKDMSRASLAAHVEGTPLPTFSQILVNTEHYKAWLCDCPEGTYGRNGSYCQTCPVNFYCPAAGWGNEARNRDPQPCPPGSGTMKAGLTNRSDCACLPGFFSPTRGQEGPCLRCPVGFSTTSYGQQRCAPCSFGLRTRWGGSSGCNVDWFGFGFVAVLQVAMIQLVWSCWRHFGGLPINDVSEQNGRWIVSLTGRRSLWILPWCRNTYPVRFYKTGNPGLDTPAEPFKVRAIPGIGQRFALLERGEKVEADPDWNRGGYLRRGTRDMQDLNRCLDTSQGSVYVGCPAELFSGRLIPAIILLPLLVLMAGPLYMYANWRQTWLLLGLAATSVVAIASASVGLLTAPRPAIQMNLANFRHVLPKPEAVPRGARRAVDVESISDLLVQFQFFIGNRNMYYVNANILMPITETTALSFAEMVGPKQTKYFVSHYWGTSFEHSMQSIMKHAQLAEGSKWKAAAYWCCSLSNNQWRIEEELGSGDLVRSSFYLALTDVRTVATVMLLDEEATALSRVWCLFEVLQTCLLSQRRPNFEGLLLCTPSGVLNKDYGRSGGSVSIDTAIAVAQTLKNLRFQDADATSAEDKMMIHNLVESYPGKHQAMNRFVRAQIRDALSLIKEKHNETFVKLLYELEKSERETSGQLPRPSLMHKTSLPVHRPQAKASSWTWGPTCGSETSSYESYDSEES